MIVSYLFLLFACMCLLRSVECEAFDGFEDQDVPEFEQSSLVEGKYSLLHAHTCCHTLKFQFQDVNRKNN
jgi:hypothetical protein